MKQQIEVFRIEVKYKQFDHFYFEEVQIKITNSFHSF